MTDDSTQTGGTVESDTICHLCGSRLLDHLVYLEQPPLGVVMGLFDVETTGFYCPHLGRGQGCNHG